MRLIPVDPGDEAPHLDPTRSARQLLRELCPEYGLLLHPFRQRPLVVSQAHALIMLDLDLTDEQMDVQLRRAIAAILRLPGGEDVPII